MLYKESRPLFFREVVGQELTCNVLMNQVKTGNVAHAMILAGIRGTGKTTLAKILGKALNCDNPTDGEPCGHCESCKEADAGLNSDIIEIDAASNNGVDYMRELKESVWLVAMRKRKVYIIDEAHMLSTSAFNALLKTLEEPPAHVVFILCTTEPHKIIKTIHSRCQPYRLGRIDIDTVKKQIKNVASQNGIAEPTEEALDLLARLSDGSMRDALTLFDTMLVDITKPVTLEMVNMHLGLVDSQVTLKIVELLINKDTKALIEYVNDIYYKGADVARLLEGIDICLRDALMARAGAVNVIIGTEDYRNGLTAISEKVTGSYITMLLDGLHELSTVDVTKTELEMYFLKSASVSKTTVEEVANEITKLKVKLSELEANGLSLSDDALAAVKATADRLSAVPSKKEPVTETIKKRTEPIARPFNIELIDGMQHDSSQAIIDASAINYFEQLLEPGIVDLTDFDENVVKEIIQGNHPISTFSVAGIDEAPKNTSYIEDSLLSEREERLNVIDVRKGAETVDSSVISDNLEVSDEKMEMYGQYAYEKPIEAEDLDVQVTSGKEQEIPKDVKSTSKKPTKGNKSDSTKVKSSSEGKGSGVPSDGLVSFMAGFSTGNKGKKGKEETDTEKLDFLGVVDVLRTHDFMNTLLTNEAGVLEVVENDDGTVSVIATDDVTQGLVNGILNEPSMKAKLSNAPLKFEMM